MTTRITEHEMRITLANMALKIDDLTGADLLDAFKQLGYGHVIEEARKLPTEDRKLSPDDQRLKDFLDANVSRVSVVIDEEVVRTHERLYGSKQERLTALLEIAMGRAC